jgi:hypothetical protein
MYISISYAVFVPLVHLHSTIIVFDILTKRCKHVALIPYVTFRREHVACKDVSECPACEHHDQVPVCEHDKCHCHHHHPLHVYVLYFYQ